MINPIFYCDDGCVGVEIDGNRYDAPDEFYDLVDGVRSELKRSLTDLQCENVKLTNQINNDRIVEVRTLKSLACLEAVKSVIDSMYDDE